MSMDLGCRADKASGNPECPNRPVQISLLVGSFQRKPLADRRLVDLDHLDPGALQGKNLLPEGKGDLEGHLLPAEIVADEGPVQNRDGTGQHAFDGTLGQGLRIDRLLDRHRLGKGHIRIDYRRLDAA
ncbi:hypothetical protein D3C71_1728090 [compost metagenome]